MPRWTQNCGVRRLPLDFRDQYFGCEIELTGINRATAAQTLADLFGTRAEHSGGGYDAYRVKDLDGKEWKIVRDSSIHPECRRRSVLIGETYKVELNSPKLEYSEMEKLQEVVRALRRAGGIVNDSCGMHVHGRFSARRSGRDEANHTKNSEVYMKLNHNKKSVKISLNLFALYAVLVCGIVFALPAFAASDPLVVVENLSTFIFSLIRAVGLILLGWGIVQVGLSLQSHDPSQRSQGFLTLAGGLVITFAKEILDLITA